MVILFFTNPYKLKSNTISSNALNDIVFEIETLGEFFRCKVSPILLGGKTSKYIELFYRKIFTVDNYTTIIIW